tara:strand:+ start:1268 stop:1738 length:471 start_codon:yes stop_codon:yes gene_type:complete
MINQVILIGNLGDDVKLHHFDGGNCVGRMPVATSRSWTNKQSGEKMTETSWHNVVVYNKIAENCEKYLKKGSKIYVSGSIAYRKWQDADGNDKYSTEINARTVQFLDPASASHPEQPKTETTSKGGKATPEKAGDDFLNGNNAPPLSQEAEDDLPF